MKQFKQSGILIFSFIVITMTSCQKEPSASFIMSKFSVKTGEIVSFTNTTTNGRSYRWDFDDGQSSTNTSPSHTFNKPGTYIITLTSYSMNERKRDKATAMLTVGTIWSGSKITFTKADGVNWTLEANQDRITANVWLTRANNQGLFNIAAETSYSYGSPIGTEWAYGTTSNIKSLVFDTWENTNESYPPTMVGQDMVLHLITDDISIDIKFLSWVSGGSGGQGGFSYERSTN